MSSSCENSENIRSCVKDIRSKNYLIQFSEINDNFEIIDKIGEGSFAVVFKVKSKKFEELKEKYALKFTIPTIDPKRIENELRILKKLGGRKNVIKLHLTFRIKDHIFMLMPFVDHLKFVDYYLLMDMKEIREYLRNLLIALRHVHENKIIHRDIKPNNFLYDRTKKKFSLVDFGLAHSEIHGDLGSWFDEDTSNIGNNQILITSLSSSSNLKKQEHITLKPKLSKTGSLNENSSILSSCICGNRLATCSGCRAKPRPHVRRGGTIGYRPPEVMMRHVEQTTAVDVWAVGIIMAIFLTGKYPFFKAEDDLDVFFGLIYFLSLEKMQIAAKDIQRHIIVDPKPLPLIGEFHDWIKSRCTFIRKQCSRIANLRRDKSENSCIYVKDYEFENSAYDLLSKLLDPVFHTRITCQEALQHEFFRTN